MTSHDTHEGSFAIVTGASSGIGLELARCCAVKGFDLLIAADEPEIEAVAQELRRTTGVQVKALEVDLSTMDGVDRLYAEAAGRPVDVLLANAGRGLGHAFLDEDFMQAKRVLDTNVTGTIYLLHKVAGDMRARDRGRILITGRSRASCPAPSKPFTTERRRSSIRFPLLCATS